MDTLRQNLTQILGEKKVFDDPETLDEYSRDESFAPQRKPFFLVKPENADEVQALVKWANRTGCPLVPVSSGAPHFYGDTVPTAAGAVVLDLSGMKRIIKIDPRNRVTMIEPGVTYSCLLYTSPSPRD